MDPKQLIPVSQFCEHHRVDLTFVESLNDYGLLEIILVEETAHLSTDTLPGLEQLVRLHNDLDINAEGIDAIHHLLHRMRDLQQEIAILKNKLENH